MIDLAKLVKPLVFDERRNNMWAAQFGYEIGWNGEGEWYRVKLDGRNICKKISGFYRAVEWASNHNTARILAAINTDAVAEALDAMLQIRAVWTDPHNDAVCQKARAALALAKGEKT
jgi:hypothetical protein